MGFRLCGPYRALQLYLWVSFGLGVVVGGCRGRGMRRRWGIPDRGARTQPGGATESCCRHWVCGVSGSNVPRRVSGADSSQNVDETALRWKWPFPPNCIWAFAPSKSVTHDPLNGLSGEAAPAGTTSRARRTVSTTRIGSRRAANSFKGSRPTDQAAECHSTSHVYT